MIAITPRAAPTPMPAFAPVDKPVLAGAAVDVAVFVGLLVPDAPVFVPVAVAVVVAPAEPVVERRFGASALKNSFVVGALQDS